MIIGESAYRRGDVTGMRRAARFVGEEGHRMRSGDRPLDVRLAVTEPIRPVHQ